jgi:osmotically-inducible protein OsmY
MKDVILILVALCLAASAQTRTTVAKSNAAHQRTVVTGRPAASDADIERTIRAKFAASKIAPNKFTVHVQGGVATLEGRADVVQHKGTATRLAKNGGAVKVVNKIQLSQAAKDKVSKNLEKGRRRAQVKRGDLRSAK